MTSSYKRQTREVYFKERKALDQSKQMFAAAKEQDKVEAKDVLAYKQQVKDSATAWKAWDNNEKLLDKENIDFWDQVSPTMAKLAGETLVKGLEFKRDLDIEAQHERFSKLSVEELTELRKESKEFFAGLDDVVHKRQDLVNRAREQGYTKYADYISGLNRNSLNAVNAELLRSSVEGLSSQFQKALLGDELIYTDADGTKFSGKDALNDKEKLEIVLETETLNLKKGILKTGMDHKILTAAWGDKIENIRTTFLNKKFLQIDQIETAKNITSIGNNLRDSLYALDLEFGGDPLNFAGKLQTSIDDLAAYYSAQPGVENPYVKARQTVSKILSDYYRNNKIAGSEDEARAKITAIVLGTKDEYRVSHRGVKGKVPLIDLDRYNLDLNAIIETGSNNLNGTPIVIDDANTQEHEARAISLGWVAPDGASDEVKGQTQKEIWKKNTADGHPPTREEVLAYFNKAVAANVGPKYLREILNYPLSVKDAAQSLSIINDLVKLNGTKFISKDSPALKGLDYKTIKSAQENGTIVLVDEEIDQANGGDNVLNIRSNINQLVPGNTLQSEAVRNKLESEITSLYYSKKYPQNNNVSSVATDPTGDALFPTDNDKVLLENISLQVFDKYQNGINDPKSVYYQVNGKFVNISKGTFDWFQTRKDKKEIAKLEASLVSRNFKKLNVNDSGQGLELTTTTQFYNYDQLANIVKYSQRRYGARGGEESMDIPSEQKALWLSQGINPWTAINNQIDLINKNLPEGAKPLDNINIPKSIEPWTSVMNSNNLRTLHKILGDGIGVGHRPNVAARRIINSRLNQIYENNNLNRIPQNGMIGHVLSEKTGNNYFYKSDDGSRVGRFGLPLAVIETAVQNNPVLKSRGFDLEKYLSDKHYQNQINNATLQEISRQANPGGEWLGRKGSIKNAAKHSRRMLNYILFGEYDIDISNVPQLRESNNALLRYSYYVNGGQPE